MQQSVLRRCICTVSFTGAVFVAAPHPARAEFETPVVITGARIVTGDGEPIESGVIVIEKGRIVAVGADVFIPAHAERLEAKGLTAYPGFIDGHSHLGIPKRRRSPEERRRAEDVRPDPGQGPLPETRFANRRGIRPEVRALEVYAPDKDALESHRSAGFTTALIAPRDGLLGGTSDLMNLSDGPIRRSVVVTDLAHHGSYDPGEEGAYPRTLLGIFAQFRQVLLDARWHARMQKYEQRHPTTAERVPTDAALESLQPLLARRQRIIFEANSEQEIRRALNLAAEFGLDIAISGAKEAYKVIDRIKAGHVPLIVSVKFDEEPEYGKKKRKKRPDEEEPGDQAPDDEESDPAEEERPDAQAEEAPGKAEKMEEKKIYEPLAVRKEKRRLWEEQVSNLIRLHEAGVPFALRTRDFDKPGEFWKNLRMVMERGLAEEAVVAALTRTPAEMLGVEERLGRIEHRLIANLTLTTGPLGSEETRVRFVFVDGEKFEIERKERGEKGAGGRSGRFRRRPGDDNGSAQPAASATAPQAGETSEDEESPAEVEEEEAAKGPDFAVELEADRVPKTRTGGNVLIRNATIIPVSSPTQNNGSILIRSGKIEAIGAVNDVPAEVAVIDATGRFVIPGFVDCHSHLGLDAVNESPLAISAEVRIADVIDPENAGIFRAVAGGTTTHHVMHGSANPIGGQNANLKLKYGRTAQEMLLADARPTVKFALGENVTRANRGGRRPDDRFPNTRMGVEGVIREALAAGRKYQDEWDTFERGSRAGEDLPPPRRDLRLEALANVVAGKLFVHSHCYRSDEILRLMHVAEDFGFRIAVLQHVLEGYRIAPEIARHGAGASTFSNFWAYKVEAYGAIPHNAALMTEHGVNVSVNSDSPNTIRYFGVEAAKSVKWGGLDEIEALKLVTLNPAQQLALDHRVGSLEVGKDGDVAIFNGHPLNTFSKCVMTLIDGEVYFEDDRPEPNEPADTVNLPGNADTSIPDTPHRAYAIVGASVHTIFGPVIENGTVVIVEDEIHDVGVNVTVPPGAGIIDAEGLHVYPGLIDCGSTLGLYEIGSLRATRDYSEIGRFTPHIRTASAVHPHSEHIPIARTAGTTTTLAFPSGGVISGQSAVMQLEGWTADEMLVQDGFALHMSLPTMPERLPDDPKRKKEIEKRVEEAQKELKAFMEKAKHYAKVKALAESDPRIEFEREIDLDAMVPYLRGEKPVALSASSYKQIVETIEFAEKHKLKWILVDGREAWKVAGQLAEHNIPVILTSPTSYPRGEYEPWDSVYRNAGELARAGVRFCFASESAAGAYNLALEAGVAVAHGLPREKAEYALTLGAAEILGISDRVGAIEVGKRANIIVTTDTPLQTVSRVTHMFIAGEPIELTSMHTENYEKFKNRPDPQLPPPPDLRGPKSLTER